MQKIILISFAFFGFCACKKDTVTLKYRANYIPQTVGSYWIYNYFQRDTNGVETPTATPADSVYVSGDTIINGKTYAVFVGSFFAPGNVFYRRDSSYCLVDPSGTIFFSENNFVDTLRYYTIPALSDSRFYMKHSEPVSVPAGTFPVLDYVGSVNYFVTSFPYINPRYMHDYYAPEVGLIEEIKFYAINPKYEIRKLIRYHIE